MAIAPGTTAGVTRAVVSISPIRERTVTVSPSTMPSFPALSGLIHAGLS